MNEYFVNGLAERLPRTHYAKKREELKRRNNKGVWNKAPAQRVHHSLINTIAAAFDGRRWREHAAIGDYGGKRGVTTYVQRFPRCCQEDNKEYAKVSLPNLIDIPGVPEDICLPVEELLRIFFFGKLGHGDALMQAIDDCSECGLEGLKEKYSQNIKDENVYKIDRIIFVASARQILPENLIECVVNAAQPKGSSRDRYKRAIPIFGVLTHAGPDENKADGELEKIEKVFMQSLGIARHRLLLCTNYCDDIGGATRKEAVLPELDVPVLEFLVQVFDRSLSVLHDDETYSETQQRPSTSQTQHPSVSEMPGRATAAFLSNPAITVIICFAFLFLGIIFALLNKRG